MKKMTLAFVVVALLLGSSGCRLPIIDPPIVGRWTAVNQSLLLSKSYEFSRDKTGEMAPFKKDATADDLKQLNVTVDFTWTYNRRDRIVSIKVGNTITELKVDYNFFRTKATIHNVNAPNYRVDYELESTPIFRL